MLFPGDDPKCWRVGVTKQMLGMLMKGVMVSTGSSVRLLGGQTVDWTVLKARVCFFLHEWCVLARLVVRAEFPSFEIAYHFRIFSLDPDHQRSMDESSINMSLACLAQFFALEPRPVIQSFFHLVGFARVVFASNPTWPMANCWAEYFVKRPQSYCGHTSFRIILLRFQNYQGNSSGVEQLFSLVEWLITSRCQLSSGSVFGDEAQLM